MDIFSDKTIYKLTAGAMLIVSIFMLSLAAITGGLKMFLFIAWLICAVLIFLLVISLLMFQKSLLSSSKSLLTRITGGVIDFQLFKIFSLILAICLGLISGSVWIYLDKKFSTHSLENTQSPQLLPTDIEGTK